jgi:hypothetical protein
MSVAKVLKFLIAVVTAVGGPATSLRKVSVGCWHWGKGVCSTVKEGMSI